MACKETNWHDVYQTYMGRSVGTCVFCGFKMTQEGIFDTSIKCPICGSKENKKEYKNV